MRLLLNVIPTPTLPITPAVINQLWEMAEAGGLTCLGRKQILEFLGPKQQNRVDISCSNPYFH